jgi:hypothetical protein
MPYRLVPLAAVLLAGAALAAPSARAGDEPAQPEAQVKKALDGLARAQFRDGSWPSGVPGEGQAGIIIIPSPRTVVTASFCGLALLASGDKRYDRNVDRAADYVAGNLFQDSGLLRIPPERDQSNWNVALGGLFLCEYAAALKAREAPPQARITKLQKVLEKLVDEVVRRMEDSGGWGHTPRVKNELGYVELEVMSNWMLAVLGAADRLRVKKAPAEKIALALRFIENCCNEGEGGVGYSPGEGQKGFGDPGRTGGALFAFALLGQEGHPLYPRLAAYWRKARDTSADGHGSIALGLLGSALGARQLGGADWDAFAAKFFPQVLDAANADGTFKHLTSTAAQARDGYDERLGVAYSTAIYTLFLQLGAGHLKFLGQKGAATAAGVAASGSGGTSPEAARLGDELAEAAPGQQQEVLAKLRDSKGAVYTDALAHAIGKLSGPARAKARDALADRLTRMSSKTLADKLQDDDLEVRRAAALACATKGDKAHLGRLIDLLTDPEAPVSRAAHAALKSLTDQDFGPEAGASRDEVGRAVASWKEWWQRQSSK